MTLELLHRHSPQEYSTSKEQIKSNACPPPSLDTREVPFPRYSLPTRMSLTALLVNTLIPQTLRVLAEALRHIADIFETAALEDDRRSVSSAQTLHTPTGTSTNTPAYCVYCTHGQRRYTFDPATEHCYFHLTRRELQERNLDRHTQVPRH